MNKHTPGPWKVNRDSFYSDFRISSDDNSDIARVHNEVDEETETNARLIAAAPELLEALQELLAWELWTLPQEVSEGYSGIEEDLARARDVVRKAIGGTE